MRTNKCKIYIISITLILTAILLAVYFFLFRPVKIYKYGITAIGETINHISLDMENDRYLKKVHPIINPLDNGKNINSYDIIPYKKFGFKKPGSNEFALYFMFDDFKRSSIIKFSEVNSNSIKFTGVFYGNSFIDFREQPVSYNFEKNNITTGRGMVYHIDTGKFSRTNQSSDMILKRLNDHKYSKLEIMGGKMIDNNRIVIQAVDQQSVGENFIILANVDDNKILNTKEVGYAPTSVILSGKSGMYWPLLLSKDKKKVAFIVKIYDKSSDETQFNLWLYLYNTDSYRFEKLTKLNGVFSSPIAIEWCQTGKHNLIALSGLDDSKNKEPYNVFIIDVDRKQIVKKLYYDAKSLHWSPDGRYLGILIRRAYPNGSEAGSSTDKSGCLYIYDTQKDIIHKVDQDETYFDFFWME